jgi:hypothetical protein
MEKVEKLLDEFSKDYSKNFRKLPFGSDEISRNF